VVPGKQVLVRMEELLAEREVWALQGKERALPFLSRLETP
jgi:hypothetical protein